MNAKKILIVLLASFALTACNEKTNSDQSAAENTADTIESIVSEPSLVESSSIEGAYEGPTEEEAANEILSDEEMNQAPSDSAVVVSDGPYVPPPTDDGDDSDSENPNTDDPNEDNEEEVVEEETAEDEVNEELCRTKGNLLHNGSFELSDAREGLRGKSLDSIQNKSWDVFQSLPSKQEGQNSWYTSSGPGIEVQGDNTVTKAPDGNRVVELDSHGAENTNSAMSQDVLLCRGKHVLKFMYYPRTKKEGDNIIEVRIGDKVIKSVDMVNEGKWIRVRAAFRVKDKKMYQISLAAKGKDNSLGGLVDKVRLHKKKRRAGVVTSLLSLGDKDNIPSPLIRREIASAIIRKSVNFASLKKKPKVLFVKDSRHGNESLDDFVLTESVLRELYGDENVGVWSEDLRMQNAEGYDVIYIINPGHPMGSSVTADSLEQIKASGEVGIVIHGDDMSRGRNFNLSNLTGLKYKSNGTNACGIRIDNNRGNKYSVKLRKRFFKKLSLESRVMDYANDIDHTEVVNKKVRILAMAKAPAGCDLKVPAIVGYKLKRPAPSTDPVVVPGGVSGN